MTEVDKVGNKIALKVLFNCTRKRTNSRNTNNKLIIKVLWYQHEVKTGLGKV